jgi:hypothetical protein
MARRNINEYERVLNVLDSELYKDKDGIIALGDIEAVFVALSDRSRPETIRAHVDLMCRLKLLTKRGDVHFKINDGWREIIKKFA